MNTIKHKMEYKLVINDEIPIDIWFICSVRVAQYARYSTIVMVYFPKKSYMFAKKRSVLQNLE